MAGKKACRNGKQSLVQKQERRTGVLSPHDELRERLLETALDVKENIPEQRNSGSSTSEGSESRKRRSTRQGPAAKRHSGEKNRSPSGDDTLDFASDERELGSSSSADSQSSRPRGQPLPVMHEEDEVFDSFDEREMVSMRKTGEEEEEEEEADNEEEYEDEEEQEEQEEYEDEEEDEEYVNLVGRTKKREPKMEKGAPCQNADFEYTKRQLNSSSMIPAPPLLSAAKCQGIGSPTKVWSLMVKRDDIPRATNCLLQNHPEMTVQMRRMLVDWIMEVCESEKLHRETFHLAIDYVDRYLEAAQDNCSQDTFQLVGTAALFIAAKYEEIYPPKCADFANLTDGAFTADNIREMEVLIVNDIGWSLSPITSIHWLSTYLQLLGTSLNTSEHHAEEANMYVPELLRTEYVDMCKILDYCLYELDSFKYSYRTLAAAVLFVTYEPKSAVEQATGFTYEQLTAVINYVRPICTVFARLRSTGEVLPEHPLVKSEDSHNIQVHVNCAEIQQQVCRERLREQQQQRRSIMNQMRN